MTGAREGRALVAFYDKAKSLAVIPAAVQSLKETQGRANPMIVIPELTRPDEARRIPQGSSRGEHITDLDALTQIKAILDATKDQADKRHCYWILGDLGRNSKAPQVADYLMERLLREKTARMRKQTLMERQFSSKARGIRPTPSPRWPTDRDMRHAAIGAVGAARTQGRKRRSSRSSWATRMPTRLQRDTRPKGWRETEPTDVPNPSYLWFGVCPATGITKSRFPRRWWGWLASAGPTPCPWQPLI